MRHPTIEPLESRIAPAALVSISEPALITEGGSADAPVVIFSVTLSEALPEPLAVDFSTIDGTAVAGSDYASAGGTLNFPPGVTSRDIAVTVHGDDLYEGEENFSVSLSNLASEFATLGTSVATASIVDDDPAPTITVQAVSQAEGTTSNPLTFTLHLSAPSAIVVTVAYATADGTARAGEGDYVSASGTVTFEPGVQDAAIAITVLGDATLEANETFHLALSSPLNATIGTTSALATLLNDDGVTLTISDGAVVEGGAGTTANMIFTVTRQGSVSETSTVHFATADAAATSGGALPDYAARSGTLRFAPGETTKTIEVPIFGDSWAEIDETFTVTLSGAVNATLVSATGTGTISNGDDTTVGLVVQDARSSESMLNGSNPVAVFRVELTKPLTNDVFFDAQTRNGTAIASGTDADFIALNFGSFKIAAGQSAVNITVPVVADTTFEASESFFLGVGAVSGGVLEARGEARGVILNDDFTFVDAKTLHYIDEDGDLATVRITKGDLRAATIVFSPVNPVTGGRVLQLLDFTGSPAQFHGTNLRITAEPQVGFDATGLETDGEVDVGFIRGVIPDLSAFELLRGIDFGSIVVEGDVGKIVAGDRNRATPSIAGKVSVQSFGARGTETGAPDVVSEFYGAVKSLNVAGDVEGIVKAIGSIGTLTIGGAIRGDATPADAQEQSGVVFFTGTLGKATIGAIVGGANADSGVLNANTNYTAKIGSLHVLGDIVGGTGSRSGRVAAKTIGSVVVDGDVRGGGGADSGAIFTTGAIGTANIGGDVRGGIQHGTGIILSGGAIGSLRIEGSLIGGTGSADSGAVIVNSALTKLTLIGGLLGAAGERSGTVQVGGAIASFNVGSMIGGAGEDSGTISAGAGFSMGQLIVRGGAIGSGVIRGDLAGGTGNGSGGVQTGGAIGKLDLRGSLIGGDAAASGAGTMGSGFVLAGRLGMMTIGGDLRSGIDAGAGLADSGSIRVHENIGALTIAGNVVGNPTRSAVISAGNNGPLVDGVLTPAIAKLTVGSKALDGAVTGGDAVFLEVLAGYGESGSIDEPRGEARNADAQIGVVRFLGDVRATSIVAGVDAGADARFGSDDDIKLAGPFLTPIVDKAAVFSGIARIVISGQVPGDANPFGIVAEIVGAVMLGGAPVLLTAGRGNDFMEIVPGTNFSVNEIFG